MKQIEEETVAIITRTKNRSVLLWRAMNSVCNQTFKDFVWVVVNDGGSKDEVLPIIDIAKKKHLDVVFVHNETSAGMEAASNIGIKACNSKYIVIHDDDDTWESDFLSNTVEFLNSNKYFGGVISWTRIIHERVKSNRIIRKKQSLQNQLSSISIGEMVTRNLFPPISFLYRRSVFEEIGEYNEMFPVTGDYEFNLRFLEKYDIGVIPKSMANHHFRSYIKASANHMGNSEFAQTDLHKQYDAVLRNKIFRRDLERNNASLGELLQLGIMHKDSRKIFDKIYQWYKNINSIIYWKK